MPFFLVLNRLATLSIRLDAWTLKKKSANAETTTVLRTVAIKMGHVTVFLLLKISILVCITSLWCGLEL